MKSIVLGYYAKNDAYLNVDHDEVSNYDSLHIEFTIGSSVNENANEVFYCIIMPTKNFELYDVQHYMFGRGYIFVHELTTDIVREILARLVETINSIEGENWHEISRHIDMYLISEFDDGEFSA